MADYERQSDLYFHGGGTGTRMMWVYGLGIRDYSLCLPGDLFCRGTSTYYSMDANIEKKSDLQKLQVHVILSVLE